MVESLLTLYSTKRCPYSQDVRDYLMEREIHFDEKDVDSEAAAQSLWLLAGVADVPTLVFSQHREQDVIIMGFDRVKLDAVLERL